MIETTILRVTRNASVALAAVVIAAGCANKVPESRESVAGTSGTSGVGAQDQDSATDLPELQDAPDPMGPHELCEAPAPEDIVVPFPNSRRLEVAPGRRTEFPFMRGLLLDDEAVIGVFPADAGDYAEIARFAKDGTGRLEVLQSPSVAGGRLFYVGDTLMHARGGRVRLAMQAPSAGMDVVEYRDAAFASDAQAMYWSSGCPLGQPRHGISRTLPDGTTTELTAPRRCTQWLVADATHVYFVDWDEYAVGRERPRGDGHRLMRVAKTGGDPEEIPFEGGLEGPFLIDDTYLYYLGDWAYRGGLQPLMRMPKSGGPGEVIATARKIWAWTLDPTDGSIFILDARERGLFSKHNCLRRLDPDGTLTALASLPGPARAMAIDDTHVYFQAESGLRKYPVYRVPKRWPAPGQ